MVGLGVWRGDLAVGGFGSGTVLQWQWEDLAVDLALLGEAARGLRRGLPNCARAPAAAGAAAIPEDACIERACIAV